MALLPTVKGIRIEDLGQDLPEWVNNLLTPISNFFESIYSALNKNITFQENIACKIFDYEYITSSNYNTGNFPNITFNTGLKNNPVGLIVLKCQNKTSPYATNTLGIYPTWFLANNQIVINYISGLANSTKYNFTFLVI